MEQEQLIAALRARIQQLAVKVVNLRRDVETANKCVPTGGLRVLADEDATPSFRDSRAFWAEVRKLTRES